MIIDNSWTIAQMQNKREKQFIINSLNKDGYSCYISMEDREWEYRIIPIGWRYPIYWLFGWYNMYLNTGSCMLYVYKYKCKDAAFNLIANLEAKDNVEYTLKNMSDREITV